jgi:hypothetical protein
VDLEKLGVPTVTLCTDAFLGLAKEEARTLGMPDLPLVIVPHPLGGESLERIQARAQNAVAGVIAALTRAAP